MSAKNHEQNIDEIFEKKFDFDIPLGDVKSKWILPQLLQQAVEDFQNSELQLLKDNLNEVKASLNVYEIGEWHKHTSYTNPASRVNADIRGFFHPELCTQAWCKFHEILCFDKPIPDHCWSSKCVNSVHICEAPGAFICSLNHFLKSRSPKMKYTWIGCTLNPYYEGNEPESCIADDRLIFNSLDKWCFGADNTGDVFSLLTLDELSQRASNMGNVDLVTADGSFNCQEKPEDQEIDTARLKYTELFYALQILGTGGSFVLKMFTAFEKSSVSVLYILCCVFDSLSVRKPSTSKPGNSELYVIARGYHGSDSCMPLIGTLRERFPFETPADLDLFSMTDIPTNFIFQHKACVEYFVIRQISVIEANKKSFALQPPDESAEFKKEVAKVAIELMELHRIPNNQCILQSGLLKGYLDSHIKLRPRLVGTFNERNNPKKKRFQSRHPDYGQPKESKFSWKSTLHASLPQDFIPIFGKPISSITLSLFCDTDKLLKLHESWRGTETGNTSISMSPLDGTVAKLLATLVEKPGQKCELGIVKSAISWRQIFLALDIKLTSASLSNVDVKATDPGDFSLLLVNTIGGQYEHGCFRELSVREPLLEGLKFALANLPEDGALVLLLPSALTRLTSCLIWLACHCFQQYTAAPNVGTSLAVPGFFLVCQGFRGCHRSLCLLKMAIHALKEGDSDQELLEIVSPYYLLEDPDFTRLVKSCNHSVLAARLCQHHEFIL